MVREEGGWKDKSSHLVTPVKVIMTLYIVFTLTKYILWHSMASMKPTLIYLMSIVLGEEGETQGVSPPHFLYYIIHSCKYLLKGYEFGTKYTSWAILCHRWRFPNSNTCSKITLKLKPC